MVHGTRRDGLVNWVQTIRWRGQQYRLFLKKTNYCGISASRWKELSRVCDEILTQRSRSFSSGASISRRISPFREVIEMLLLPAKKADVGDCGIQRKQDRSEHTKKKKLIHSRTNRKQIDYTEDFRPPMAVIVFTSEAWISVPRAAGSSEGLHIMAL